MPELICKLQQLDIVVAIFQDTQQGEHQNSYRLYIRDGDKVGKAWYEVKQLYYKDGAIYKLKKPANKNTFLVPIQMSSLTAQAN
jgi:uncharacterized protein (DUF736 family)